MIYAGDDEAEDVGDVNWFVVWDEDRGRGGEDSEHFIFFFFIQHY